MGIILIGCVCKDSRINFLTLTYDLNTLISVLSPINLSKKMRTRSEKRDLVPGRLRSNAALASSASPEAVVQTPGGRHNPKVDSTLASICLFVAPNTKPHNGQNNITLSGHQGWILLFQVSTDRRHQSQTCQKLDSGAIHHKET